MQRKQQVRLQAQIWAARTSILCGVKDAIWRAVGRWLLVPPAFLFGLVLGYIFLNLSFLFEQACIRWTRTLTLSPSSLLEFYADCMDCWIRVAYEAGAPLRVGTDARPSARGGLRLDETVFGISYIHPPRGR